MPELSRRTAEIMRATEPDPLIELLRQMQPQLKQLFHRFRIPAEAAEGMLEDCMMVMVYRHDQLARPDRWLLRTLRSRCVRHWHEKRRALCEKIDAEIRLWLEDRSIEPREREERRAELARAIDRVPLRCRPLLRRAYKLTPVSGEPPLPIGNQRSPLRLGLQPPENPWVRCLSQLLRQLVAQPPS